MDDPNDATGLPAWVAPLVGRLAPLDARWAPVGDERPSAVVALLSLAQDPDLVLTLRASGLDYHSGQICLPGGGREPGDLSPADTALREAMEEIGLPPSSVRPVGQLRTRQIVASHNRVVPVVGLWSGTDPLSVSDKAEVETILRWPISDLADPDHRVTVRHPLGGMGPAWQIDDLFLWGFTAYVVDALIRLANWEHPWDTTNVVAIPPRFLGKNYQELKG